MFTKKAPTRIATIFALVLFVTLSVAWGSKHYSGSVVVRKGGGGWFNLVNGGKDKVTITVWMEALDEYMAAEGVSSVEVTAELEEKWVSTGKGKGYYRLEFTFGPSGAFFTRDLEIELRGKYIQNPTVVTLVDEDGEALPHRFSANGNKLVYYIPHFSNYYYDNY